MRVRTSLAPSARPLARSITSIPRSAGCQAAASPATHRRPVTVPGSQHPVLGVPAVRAAPCLCLYIWSKDSPAAATRVPCMLVAARPAWRRPWLRLHAPPHLGACPPVTRAAATASHPPASGRHVPLLHALHCAGRDAARAGALNEQRRVHCLRNHAAPGGWVWCVCGGGVGEEGGNEGWWWRGERGDKCGG